MVNLTFYGGVGEIGGNKILLEEGNSRIFLDFGSRLGFSGNFFSEFLDTRTNTELKDKITLGVLPKIPGIYRDDLVRPEGFDDQFQSNYKRVLPFDSSYFDLNGIETFNDYLEKKGEHFLDAIFLTHAHLDHSGDIGYIDPSIPLYCSKVTDILTHAIDDVTKFKSNAIISKKKKLGMSKKGYFPDSPKIINEEIIRKCVALEDQETVNIGRFSIKLINQDHSIPGASSFLVESSGKKILYTGDIRFHGTHPMSIDEYVGKVGGNVNVMICEGTRIESGKATTEHDIKDSIVEKSSNTKGLVFVDFSWKDTTRYETIRDAAVESGRIFVINARLAYLLEKLGMYPEDDNVKVLLKRRGSCMYSPSDYTLLKHEIGLSVKWDVDDDSVKKKHYDNGIIARDLVENPDRYIVMLSYYDLNQIFDLANRDGIITDSRFIRAQCEPFSDEMELDEERFINWLEKFGIKYDDAEYPIPEGCENSGCQKIRKRMNRAHVSGHASKPEIIELVEKVNPKVLIPVHTEKPEMFESLFKDKGIKVIIPEMYKPYSL